MNFEGDVKLSICPDECGIKYQNGNPVMTGGIDNAILISEYTAPGWWANLLISNESEKYGSEYEEAARGVITAGKLKRIQDKGEDAIQWMIKEKISSKNEVVSNNPQADRIESTIKVIRPATGAEKYEINWKRQFEEDC
jgi:phage gp46-like protein